MASKERICEKCGQLKKHYGHGLCKSCYLRKYREENKKRIKESKIVYYQKNKEKENKRHIDNYYNNIDGKTSIKKDYKTYYRLHRGGRPVHTVIAEKVLGRRLKKNECVHHLDGNGLNNKHSNLIICSNKFHGWLHRSKDSYLFKSKEQQTQQKEGR